MQQKINFNVNEYILVKLAEFGKIQLCKDHYEFWISTGMNNIPKFNLPKEDSFGYSKWQLWDLMERLGKYCGLAREIPFETEIIFIKDKP